MLSFQRRLHLDRELDLLITASRRHLSADQQVHAAALLADGSDPQRLYNLAETHHLKMVLYRGLIQLGAASPLRDRLEREAAEQALFYEFVYPQQLAAVLAALDAAGIRALILKGYALGQAVYDQPVLRAYTDFDLLIPPDQIMQAAHILTELGYTRDTSHDYPPDYDQQHHHLVPYVHPEWLPVELHQRLVTPQGSLHIDYDSVWAQAQRIDIDGTAAETLSVEHLLIYLALHAACNHLFNVGLRALCDMCEVIAAREVPWTQVVADCRAWGCTRQVYMMLRIASEFYGPIAPEAVFAQLCPQGIAPEFLNYGITNVLETTMAGLKTSSGLAEVWQSPDPAQRWWAILARFFPPSSEVARTYDLANTDWKRWLYYPRWQARLMQRHLATGLSLLRSDPATLERAQQEAVRRDLIDWMSKA
ncbi:MAG: nucleotidyltransferase family protein [Anaerolineae bacterium]|nr:nucleotidyltransferase family protein [Anaerolineae bacterium]